MSEVSMLEPASPCAPARWLYVSVGTMCVGLGLIGVVVPGMPTTVFLLIASYCYARSSPRMSAWLMQHRILGPYLRNIRDHRAMPRRAKVISLLSIWVAISVSAWMLWATWWAPPLLVACGLIPTVIILGYLKTLEKLDLGEPGVCPMRITTPTAEPARKLSA